MKIIIALILLCSISARAAYTEFYCNTTGTNVNAGSTTNATPTFSATAGDWVDATGVYTKAASDLSGVTAGMWASVYVDGAVTAVFVGRITAVDDGADTITVSKTIKTGTGPADGTGNRSIRVGGAWYGPWYTGGTVDNLPFNFVNNLLTNTSHHPPRISLKNDRIYATTNVVNSSNGPMRFQGFATNAGDLGVSWITGSTAGVGHNAVTFSGANTDVVDLTFATNGTSGSANIVLSITGTECHVLRCVIRDSRGPGVFFTAAGFIEESEAFLCNAGNGAQQGGINLSTAGSVAKRCISHDNAGTGSSGFILGAGAAVIDCISESNGRDGATVTGSTPAFFSGCDFYNNGTNGIDLAGSSATVVFIENCNFIGNGVGLTGAYAINSSGSLLRNGQVFNCGFGTGTATNGNGGANVFPNTGLEEIGSVAYTANAVPWVDPANGDFRINLAASINAGRGRFTQTAASYAGAVGYPDIGAAQATNAASGSGSIVAYPIFRR